MTASLTKKMVWLVVLGFIFSFLMLAGLVWWESRLMIREAVSDQQLIQNRLAMDRIDNFLYERYYDITLISHSIQAEQILNQEEASGYGDKDWIGYELVKLGPWEVVSLINEEGIIVNSSEGKIVGGLIENYSEEEQVFERAKDGLTVFSDAVTSKMSGNKTVIFATPLWSQPGERKFMSGVVVGQISWALVEEILNDVQTDAVLVNKEGMLIAQNNKATNLLDLDLSETTAVKHFIESKLDHTHQVRSISGEYQSITSHVAEEGYLDYLGNNWGLVLELPNKVAFAGVSGQMQRLLLLIVPVLILMGFVIVYLMKINIVNPLREITKASKSLSKGEFSNKIKIRSGDELGELSMTFNNMAEQINVSQKELESKVFDKTKEYEKKNIELEKANKLMVGRELKMIELKKLLSDKQIDKD